MDPLDAPQGSSRPGQGPEHGPPGLQLPDLLVGIEQDKRSPLDRDDRRPGPDRRSRTSPRISVRARPPPRPDRCRPGRCTPRRVPGSTAALRRGPATGLRPASGSEPIDGPATAATEPAGRDRYPDGQGPPGPRPERARRRDDQDDQRQSGPGRSGHRLADQEGRQPPRPAGWRSVRPAAPAAPLAAPAGGKVYRRSAVSHQLPRPVARRG